MYTHSKQDNGLAGVPFLMSSAQGQGTAGLTEAKASRFNPAGNFLTSVRYRLQQELGGRRSFFDRDYQRFVTGINGDFNFKDNGFISHFGYDSGFVYEHLTQVETDSGDAVRGGLGVTSNTGIRGAINGTLVPGVFFNPFIGQNAPITGFAPTYTPLGVPTGLTAFYDNRSTAQAASYIGHSIFNERDWLADAKINAHLLPNLYNGGIDFSLGYEHREIAQHSIPDPVQAAGDQLGFNQAPNTKTLQKADSVFFEFAIPIVTSTMNIPGIRSMDMSIAWRYEKFHDEDNFSKASGSFDNVNQDENFGGAPRVSLRYQPIADITLRASWGQSFRSPQPSDLFDPPLQDFPQLFDINNPTGPLTLQPPSGVLRAGNPAVQPEKTDSYTGGIVWTPKFLPGFTMTADWYQLYTTSLILSGDNFAQVLLTRNQLAPNQSPANGCDVNLSQMNIGVVRDANGFLQCVNSMVGNAGKRNVQGLDVTATYEIPTERFGKFTLSGGWNHFFTWKAQPGEGQSFNNFLGNYNNGTLPLAPGAIPWNKGFIRGEWEWRHFDFVATGNYVGDFRDDPAFFGAFVGVRTVPSYITLDMQLAYEFVKPTVEPAPTYAKDAKDGKNVMQPAADTSTIWQRMLWGTKLTVGVNDAFDRQPPSVLGAFNDNYDTSLYSIRNRFWYVSMNKKF
jgi:iron complex outermembrane receptor protein